MDQDLPLPTTIRKLDIGNTILAQNTVDFPVNLPNDIWVVGGTFTSAGNNLIGTSHTPITFHPSDILNTNPLIGALQNNGGPTPTHALLSGSSAIDAGSNALAVDASNNSPLTTDQRGFTRIVDAPPAGTPIVDIGAFEFAALTPTAAGLAVAGRVVSIDGRAVPRAMVTIIGTNGQAR